MANKGKKIEQNSTLKKITVGEKKTEVVVSSRAASPATYITIDNMQIRNQVAYNQFLELKDSQWLSNKRYYQSINDKLLKIDLLCNKTTFKNAIVHLPDSEKRYAEMQKFIVEQAYYKITKLKQKALGEKNTWQTEFAKYNIDDMIIIENRKADMLALFGKMWSAEEVHREVVQEWGVKIAIHSIENFRTKNLDKILELQKEYTHNFKDVRLGYKKSRLEEYMWLYNDTKQQYENSRNKEDRKFLKDLLESIKREVEGDLIRIEGDMQVNIEATLKVHIQKEIYSKLPINEMILTRVAQKSGVNPLLLLHRLQNSYYSKFTGFSKDAENTIELPEYPSSQVYDLDKLSIMHKKVIGEEKSKRDTFNEFMKVSQQRLDSGKSIKQAMIERLKKRKKDLNEGINRINKA